ncbi:FHA domain-containing protein [Streptomyces sp. NPDC100445]|uniref:FHA domain-containing protein n=1 Tax=Streptomyces sp. NPDC100445 TaxID=3366102 RepID=UPI0037FFD7A9
MPTCPNGHQSGSDDWCEVCGHRMAGAVPPPPPPAGGYGFPPPAGPAGPGGRTGAGRPHAGPAAEPELCPQCRTPREGGAPFCEECRWNFLTNTATSYTPAAPRSPSPQPRFQPPSPTYGGDDGFDYQGSRPSQINRPAEPIPSFTSEPSGPTPFAGERRPAGPPTGPGPAGAPPFAPGGQRRPGSPPPFPGTPDQSGRSPFPSTPDQSGRPPFSGSPDQSGRPPFGGPRGQGPQGQGQGQGPGGGPSGFGGGQDRGQGPGGGPSGFGGGQHHGHGQGQGQGQGPGGPSGFGGGQGQGQGPQGPGPGAAPQAYQQAGAPAPPAFPREGGRTRTGDDDWTLPPPSTPGPSGPGQGPGGYGYPQPGATQAPSGPGGFPQAPQAPHQPQQQHQPATWTATIGPDREYFMAMMQRSGPEAAGLNLPAYSPEQRRTLTGNQVTIGRRRHSTGDTPDIDLSVPPEDPGVSHQHAMLVQQPDGSWAVVDQNSTNGTTVNMSEEPIQPFVPVPLQDGDRVHVGAWTSITVHRG